jgi:hypothetical protein
MDQKLNFNPGLWEDTSKEVYEEHSENVSEKRVDAKKKSAHGRLRNPKGARMKKDLTICFRTSSEIRNYLDAIAGQQRLSLSYVIESIIYQHQEQSGQAKKPVDPDRRHYQRKQVMLPAFIGRNLSHVQEFETGSVLDISLGGIRIAVSEKTASKIRPHIESAEYSVIFTLPDQRQPVTVRCRPQSVLDAEEEVQIGAAFVDADFHSYQNLQKYLI